MLFQIKTYLNKNGQVTLAIPKSLQENFKRGEIWEAKFESDNTLILNRNTGGKNNGKKSSGK